MKVQIHDRDALSSIPLPACALISFLLAGTFRVNGESGRQPFSPKNTQRELGRLSSLTMTR